MLKYRSFLHAFYVQPCRRFADPDFDMRSKYTINPVLHWQINGSEKENSIRTSSGSDCSLLFRGANKSNKFNFFYRRMINSPIESASYRQILWLNILSDGITNWSILKDLAWKFLRMSGKVSDDGWAREDGRKDGIEGGREQGRLMKSLLIFLHSTSASVGWDGRRGRRVEGSYIISLNLEGCSLICSGAESRQDGGVCGWWQTRARAGPSFASFEKVSSKWSKTPCQNSSMIR